MRSVYYWLPPSFNPGTNRMAVRLVSYVEKSHTLKISKLTMPFQDSCKAVRRSSWNLRHQHTNVQGMRERGE
jgi:hypothetical protein